MEDKKVSLAEIYFSSLMSEILIKELVYQTILMRVNNDKVKADVEFIEAMKEVSSKFQSALKSLPPAE